MVADVSYMCCSEFEELRLLALAAGQEVPSLLRVLCGLQDCAQHLAIGIFAFHWVEGFLKDYFLCLSILLVQENIAETGPLAKEVSGLAEDLGLVKFHAKGDD